MIFYETTAPDGLVQLAPTQADAKAIDRNFKQLDLPTDKAGYMSYVNGLLRQIHELRLGASLNATQPQPDDGDMSHEAQTARMDSYEADVLITSEAEAAAAAEPTPEAPPTPTGLDVTILEQQVELLAENPEQGFDQLEQHFDITGVGGAFSRGVHILSIIAAGEHQLARLLFRSRKQKGWGK